MKALPLLLTLGLVWPLALPAQDEAPGVATSGDLPVAATAEPALPTAGADTDVEPMVAPDQSGTVIVGDRESPIGLYIMPWRNSAARADMDRPVRLVHSEILPIDEPVFVRKIEYHNALSDTLESRNIVTPDVPAVGTP